MQWIVTIQIYVYASWKIRHVKKSKKIKNNQFQVSIYTNIGFS